MLVAREIDRLTHTRSFYAAEALPETGRSFTDKALASPGLRLLPEAVLLDPLPTT